MSIPVISGTAKGKRSGSGGNANITVTPPVGVEWLALVVSDNEADPAVPATNFTQIQSWTSGGWSFSRLYRCTGSPGSTWRLDFDGVIIIYGLDRALKSAPAVTPASNTVTSPTATASEACLVVRTVSAYGDDGAALTYPTGAPDNRLSETLVMGPSYKTTAGFATSNQSASGSVGTAAWTVPGWGLAGAGTILLYGVDQGEHKTSSAAISLGLSASATASKHAAAGVELDLELSTAAGQAKAVGSDAMVGLLLDLAASETKTAHSEAALTLLTGITADAAKTGASSVGLGVLLGLDASASKTGVSAAALGLDLVLVGHTSEQPPEHKTASASLAVGLTIDALAGKRAASDVMIGLSVALDGEASKTGVATVPLTLVIDAIASAAKTAGASAALELALTLAASRTTALRDVTLCAADRRPALAATDRRLMLAAEDRRPTLLAEDRSVPCHA